MQQAPQKDGDPSRRLAARASAVLAQATLAGLALFEGVALRVGLLNLTGEQYVTHRNSASPFTRHRIAEPGPASTIGGDYGF